MPNPPIWLIILVVGIFLISSGFINQTPEDDIKRSESGIHTIGMIPVLLLIFLIFVPDLMPTA